jgi:hypothetical protein
MITNVLQPKLFYVFIINSNILETWKQASCVACPEKNEFKLKLDKFRLPAKNMTQGVPHFRCKPGDV